ncbi:MAG: transposase [Paracoccaceae bacterium]
MQRRIGKQDRFTDGFKHEAVASVVDRGHAVSEVAGRLGSAPRRCTRGRRGLRGLLRFAIPRPIWQHRCGRSQAGDRTILEGRHHRQLDAGMQVARD